MKTFYTRSTLFFMLMLGLTHLAISQAKVDIQTPDGTEEMKFGEVQTISWVNGDMISTDRFYLYYSVDGGVFTAILNNALPSQLNQSGDTLSYDWTIPDLGRTLDSQVRVRVLNNTRNVSDTSESFRVYYESDVDIQTPDGTEEMKFGEVQTISWVNGDMISTDRFYLYYSVDGGVFTAILNNALPSQLNQSGDTLSYDWTIPDLGRTLDSQVRVRVLNNTRNVSDTSESFRVYYESDVDIQTPDGTEEMKFGEVQTISWVNGDMISTDRFYLYYSVDGGVFTAILNNALPSQLNQSGDTLSYDWTIPDLGRTLDSQVRVRVLNNTRNVSDTSESFRVYYESDVDIQTPDGTEEMKFGEVQTISWVNGDMISTDRFYLYYSVDGGVFTAILNNALPSQLNQSGDTLSYDWTIPDLGRTLDSQVRVRVLNNTRNVSDTSESFRVYYESDVEIVSPVPGAFLLPSTTQTISWLNGDMTSIDRFYLYYSVDGGGFTAILNNALPSQLNQSGDTLSYNWTVPATESTNVRIRVLNNTRNVSDTTFSFLICTTCPAVALYTPNGGEVLGIGETVEIGWNAGDTWSAGDNVKVDYSSNGGATFETPAIFDGNYSEITENKISWTVPDDETTSGIVRVSNVTLAVNDVSDAAFTITTPPGIPTDFTALATSVSGAVNFTWTDNATNETNYIVQYSSNKVSWLPWSGNLGVDANSFSTTGVNNVGYWWRIAVSSSAFTSYSEEVWAGNFSNANRAISLDGTDDHIVIGEGEAFDFGTGDFTIEAWINANDLSSSHTIISDYNNTSTGSMGFVTSAGGGLSAFIGSGSFDLTSVDNILTVDKWDHVALKREGDAAFIYLNGQQVATTTGLAARTLNSEINMTIGKQPSGIPFYFNGQIDEVRIWNTAVSDEDILANYFTQLAGDETGLLAYYQMNHTSGTVVGDRTDNNYSATWSGTASGTTSPSWVTSQALTDNLPPAAPTDFVISKSDPSGLDFSWIDNAINETVYTVQWSNDKINWSNWASNNLGVDATSYTITNIGNNGYWFRVFVSTGVLTATSEELFAGRFSTAGKAISLDGTDDAIVIRDAPAFDFGTGDFTIEAWFNTNSIEAIHTIISDYNNTSSGSFRVLTTADGAIAASVGSDVFDITSPEGIIETNKWNHMALTRAEDSLFLYFNGLRVADASGMASRSLASEATMTIGKQATGTPFYFNGEIDEVRIWNIAVSPDSLEANYFTELDGDENGLLAYYQLNHQAGIVVSDQSGNDYKADWTGSAEGFRSPQWANSSALVDNTPPAAPTDFVITENASNGLDFSWTDNATNETVYTLQLSNNKTTWSNWVSNNLGVDVSSYTSSSIINNGYWFRVAVSTGVNTAYSEELYKGRFTSAYRGIALDGTDDQVQIDDMSFLDNTDSFTLEAWVTVNDLGVFDVIMGSGSSLTSRVDLQLDNGTGKLLAVVANGAETYAQSAQSLVVGKWYHVAMAYAGTGATNSDRLKMYINGQPESTTYVGDIPTSTATIGSVFSLGAYNSSFYLQGILDEVRLWSKTLTDAEILSNYLEQLSGTEEGLEGYYQLNHTDGIVVSDQSINDKRGTWSGATGTFTSPSWAGSTALIDNTPFLSITEPEAGAFWEVGTSQTIRWSMNNFLTTDNIEVRLSADGGTTSAVISEGASSIYDFTSTQSSYTLTVPDSVSEQARIIVVNTTQNISDTTAVFEIGTIERSITLITPNGGERLIRGETYNVKFELEGIISSDNISIYFSSDNGASFPTLLANGALSLYSSDSSFNWLVNSPITDEGMLRILVSNRGVADTTDAVFSIIEPPVAPVYSNLSATIIGDDFELGYSMSEAGTSYLVVLPDGSSIPTGEQIKAAALGESAIEGQLAFGSYAYTEAGELVTQTGSAPFTRLARYDFYLSAEDAEGELNPGQAIANRVSQFTPFENDSIDVNTIYSQAHGANWENTTEAWTELPIADRTEIVVDTNIERIVELDLSNKGISGTFPSTITSLDSLRTLDMSDNQITTIPNMSFMEALSSLDVSNNSLEFSTLLNNAGIFTSGDQYSPQALILEKDSIAIPKGSTYTIIPTILGEGNVYDWQVDNYNTFDQTFATIADANSTFYRVENIDYDNMGTYKLDVTNPALPDLTLSTGLIQVWATATLDITVTGANDVLLDQGAAYALRNRGPGLPFDSIPKVNGIPNPDGLLFTNGNAIFENLILGEYLVAIRADPEKYLPTYYSSTFLWEEADTLDFKGNLEEDMTMFALPDPLGPGDGEGAVGGSIETDFPDETGAGGRISARRKVKKAGCSMRRFVRSGRPDQEEDTWELVAYVESDDDGRFQFDFLPPNTYRFNIEYPGIPMDPDSFVEFVIPEGGDDNFVLEAVITEGGIGVRRTNSLGFTDLELDQFKVFPNPTTDRIFLSHPTGESLMVQIVTLSGQIVAEHLSGTLDSQLAIDTYQLEGGMYFLHVKDLNDPSRLITYKIVVRH